MASSSSKSSDVEVEEVAAAAESQHLTTTQTPKKCDFCAVNAALLYCPADSANLCLVCDREMHSANALSIRHFRVMGRIPEPGFSGCPSAADLARLLGILDFVGPCGDGREREKETDEVCEQLMRLGELDERERAEVGPAATPSNLGNDDGDALVPWEFESEVEQVEHGKAPLLNASSKKITLRSMDGKLFEVEEAVTLMLETIEELDEIDGVVSLPKVRGDILVKVIEYCNMHVKNPHSDDPSVNEEIKNWDAQFLKYQDPDTLSHLVGAAGYLKLNSLEDLAWPALINRHALSEAQQSD